MYFPQSMINQPCHLIPPPPPAISHQPVRRLLRFAAGRARSINHQPVRRLLRFAAGRARSINHQPVQSNASASLAKHRQSIINQSDASASLAKHLISSKAKGDNFVFSPLSLHVALGLITAGSAGPTRDQLLNYLKSNSIEELNALSSQLVSRILADGSPFGGPRLSTANGLWVDQSLTLKSHFKGIVQKDYRAASNNVDFQKPEEVRQEVNTWAENETKGLIKDLLPPGSVGDAGEQLICANAVYFKGIWEEQFKSSLTKHHKFFLLNGGGSVQVPFMTSRDEQLIRACKGFKVLTLPYKQGKDKGRQFSMHIFLPDARDGLPALVEKFGTEVEFVKHHLPSEYVQLRRFLVPKFKINFSVEASKVLKGQGLVLPFTPGGFTEMVDPAIVGRYLFFTAIYHKAFIEVNEEGTEAAAATALVMGIGCGSPVKKPTLDFVADHPFLFVVREDVSGVIIFIGQVTNPLLDD